MLPVHGFITGAADNVILQTGGLGGKQSVYEHLLSIFLILKNTVKVAQAEPAN